MCAMPKFWPCYSEAYFLIAGLAVSSYLVYFPLHLLPLISSTPIVSTVLNFNNQNKFLSIFFLSFLASFAILYHFPRK